jgi:amino acid adenylation domain-containing protein/thioester reductase-like protein
VQDLIGFFTNTLVLRCPLVEKLTVKEWLVQIREIVLVAFQHQDLPFNKLVELLQPTFEKNYNPFFQVLLVVFEEEEVVLKLPSVEIESFHIKTKTAKFDMTLFIQKTRKGLHGWVEYNTNLFKHNTIAKFVTNFRTLISNFVNAPEESIANLGILAKAEQDLLLTLWNATQADYPRNKCIHQLFERQVELTSKAIAVKFHHQSLSYEELNRQANHLAYQLQKIGIDHTSLVAICAEPSIDMIVGMLAVLKTDAGYLPLDPTNPKVRLQTILEDSKAKVVLIQKKLLDKLSEIPAQQWVFPEKFTSHQINIENLDLPGNPENIAYVIYTSGTTGKPKGIALSHHTLTNLIPWQIRQSRGYQRVALFSAFSFDVATQTIFFSLISGATLIIVPKEIRGDPFMLLRFLKQEQVDIIFMPPAVLQNLAETFILEKQPLEDLREIIVSGDVLRITSAIHQFFQHHRSCKLTNQYGPSETHVATSFRLAGEPENWPTLPSIGRPIDNAQIYLLDKYLNPVPRGVIGELYIGGVMLAKGYLGQQDLTAIKFITNPFQEEQRIYRTNDLARYREDGNLEFIGRVDFQIKIRGFRVELDEINAQLETLDFIKQAVTILREDVPNDPKLVAYIVIRPKEKIDLEAVRNTLVQRLPDYMVPSYFIILEKMPLNVNGKIDRSALPKPDYREIQTHVRYVAPKTVIQAELCNYWSELLGVERVGVMDNFFELGGHSLLATRLLLYIRSHFATTIPLNQFFNQPTIVTLEKLIKRAKLPSEISIELEKDTNLDREILPLGRMPVPTASPKAILLTGANGFLGVHLLHELLENTTAKIYCLVRSNDQNHAALRLTASLENYHFEGFESNPRVVPVVGDLAKPKLGISNSEYTFLAEDIDTIYHNGAFVHHIYNYEKLRDSNVLSTLELIKFSGLKKAKRIHFISTLAAACKIDVNGNILEDFPDAKSQCRESGYATSKWVAERLLASAHNRGFAVSIYRPGYITGQSSTGICPTTDNHLLLFIKGCIQLGYAPKDWGTVDMLPVDFVAKAIVLISLQESSQGKVFNLNNPFQPNWNKVFSWINEAGYPIHLLTYRQWRDQYLAGIDENNALFPLLPLYLTKTVSGEQEKTAVKNNSTQHMLQVLNLNYPKINKKLFDIYLHYLAFWLK